MRKNSINGSTVYTYNPEYNRNSYKKNKKAKEKGSSMKKKIVSILLVAAMAVSLVETAQNQILLTAHQRSHLQSQQRKRK